MVPMTTLDYVFGGLVLLVFAAVSPFIYEQATSDIRQTDEQYWLEHGYPPLEVVVPARGTDEM